MKFLCIPCDEPMKLIETMPPDRGSMTVVYRCPTCEHRIAMLTNPYETEVVGSLGVKIGGASVSEGVSTSETSGKCPFAKTVSDVMGTKENAPTENAPEEIAWTQEALERLQNIPEFVRPMAKKGIEKMALDNGYPEIDVKVLDEAKEFFGM